MAANRITNAGVYAPAYYTAFQCMADRCQHSCCINWEIGIDNETYTRYQQLVDVLPTLQAGEDSPTFRLCADGRCPHLNERGLCRIILCYGEEFLSEICRNHPRFFNHFPGGRVEAGLGLVCEEACRLVLENKQPFSLYKIEDFDVADDADTAAYQALPERDRIMAIIDSNACYEDVVAALNQTYSLPDITASQEWMSRFLLLEILDPAWKRDLEEWTAKPPFIVPTYDHYYARLLTAFVYRHVSLVDCEVNMRARLAFCLLSVAVIRSLFEGAGDCTLENLMDWVRRYSAEIEYSEDNTDELIFALESRIGEGK